MLFHQKFDFVEICIIENFLSLSHADDFFDKSCLANFEVAWKCSGCWIGKDFLGLGVFIVKRSWKVGIIWVQFNEFIFAFTGSSFNQCDSLIIEKIPCVPFFVHYLNVFGHVECH